MKPVNAEVNGEEKKYESKREDYIYMIGDNVDDDNDSVDSAHDGNNSLYLISIGIVSRYMTRNISRPRNALVHPVSCHCLPMEHVQVTE